jgi:8-oxo-dGTP diphosphatase
VAVGVLRDSSGNILISRRHVDAHQGGLWEFPGGKVEPGEAVVDALRRELLEELGVYIADARPLLDVQHDYPDKAVWLDVWLVREFSGDPLGREGQAVLWVSPAELARYEFPAANTPIVAACQELPPA